MHRQGCFKDHQEGQTQERLDSRGEIQEVEARQVSRDWRAPIFPCLKAVSKENLMQRLKVVHALIAVPNIVKYSRQGGNRGKQKEVLKPRKAALLLSRRGRRYLLWSSWLRRSRIF